MLLFNRNNSPYLNNENYRPEGIYQFNMWMRPYLFKDPITDEPNEYPQIYFGEHKASYATKLKTTQTLEKNTDQSKPEQDVIIF